MSDNQPCVNTDRELWREVDGDYYAPRVFVTTDGGIGIDVGGFVIVKPVRQWHALGATTIGTPAPHSLEDCSRAIKNCAPITFDCGCTFAGNAPPIECPSHGTMEAGDGQ
jgi:hypothetical protein